MSEHPIFHLALPTDWATAFETGAYRMSTRGQTLDEVGFIHCSHRDQVEATANTFYGDLDELVLLTIDPDRVDAEIVEEPPAPGSDLLFPHIYGALPVRAVTTATFWTRSGHTWSLDDL